jgi:hypothetical protein
VSVYTVPSLVVYTGTQNRLQIEWQSKGNDQIIHAMRVSTNTVVAEPDSLTMLAYQSSCVSFTRPPPPPLPNPQSSQPAIQRSVLVLSFRPRPNWRVSTGVLQHKLAAPQASTYLSWLPEQQWIKHTGSKSQISLSCNILALMKNV